MGVFAAYASHYGYCLIGHRLFIPEKWFTDQYADRRRKCKFPEDLQFKTKPRLAVELFEEISQQQIIPFRYVVADSIYGNSPEFIEAVENIIVSLSNLPGVTYFVSMPHDTLCWLKKPVTVRKQYRHKGELRSKKVLKSPEQQPLPFETIAKNMNKYFWYRRKVSEGTKGPIEYEFTRIRVVSLSNYVIQKRASPKRGVACYQKDFRWGTIVFLFHQQCSLKYPAEASCVA